MSPKSAGRAVHFLRPGAPRTRVLMHGPPMAEVARARVGRPPWSEEVGAPTSEGRARCVRTRSNLVGAPRALLVAVISGRAILTRIVLRAASHPSRCLVALAHDIAAFVGE